MMPREHAPIIYAAIRSGRALTAELLQSTEALAAQNQEL